MHRAFAQRTTVVKRNPQSIGQPLQDSAPVSLSGHLVRSVSGKMYHDGVRNDSLPRKMRSEAWKCNSNY